jgi:hypothetical protein
MKNVAELAGIDGVVDGVIDSALARRLEWIHHSLDCPNLLNLLILLPQIERTDQVRTLEGIAVRVGHTAAKGFATS